MTEKPKQWYQFRLLTLLIVFVVLSVGLGWFAFKWREAEREKRAVEAVEKAGGWVLYDYEFDKSNRFMVAAELPGPAWLRERMGVNFLSHVRSVVGYGGKGGDEGLEHIKKLSRVRALELSGSQVTDRGLENLKGLKRLRMLFINGTQVTDRGLEHLKGLTELRWLYLSDTQVTDRGLEYLTGLTELETLELSGTRATSEGIQELQATLPDCRIICEPRPTPPTDQTPTLKPLNHQPR